MTNEFSPLVLSLQYFLDQLLLAIFAQPRFFSIFHGVWNAFNAKMGLAIKTHMWQAASVSEPSLYELGLLSYAVLNMKMVKATYDQDKQAVKNLCCLILENFVITECDSCCKERTA